jgi:hypothetical protein
MHWAAADFDSCFLTLLAINTNRFHTVMYSIKLGPSLCIREYDVLYCQEIKQELL